MSLHLCSGDLSRLQSAIRTLLSPLDYGDPDEWRLESLRAARDLVGADVACFGLALEGRPFFHVEPEQRAAVEALERRYASLDGGLDARRRELGLEVAHVSKLFDMDAYRRTEFWNDYIVPFRLFDTVVLLSDVGPGGSPAGLIFHHDRPAPARPFGERELALLWLLLPAVKAGVAACVELQRNGDALTRAIDSMTDCALLCDGRGRVLHANPACVRTLECDPLPEKLLWVSRTIARGLASLLSRDGARRVDAAAEAVSRSVRTPAATYRLRGSLLRADAGNQALALIVLERHDRTRPSEATLRNRFGLSPRQAGVALLLAERKTNTEIAAELGISPHTARRHTEQVLLRLDVRSRREVHARILDP